MNKDLKDYGLAKTVTVLITKNKMTKISKQLPQWEAHVMLALWGDDAEIVGEPTLVRTALPASAQDEFARLASKYGPKDADVPVVAQVYGSFGPGLRALEKEIELSFPKGKTTKTAKSTKARAKVKDEDEVDALSDVEVDALANTTPSVSFRGKDGKIVVADDFSDLATEEDVAA